MNKTKTTKRFLSIVITFAILLAGVNISPNTKTAEAASYSYTYTTGIPDRQVDVVDGVTTLTVGGSSYVLTLKLTADDAACDQYGTCFIRYKNGAIYFASYELEGTSMVKHRLYLNGQAVYANKLLFKGSNKYIATHYEYNEVEYELPNLDVLRQQLGLSSATATPVPTTEPMPTMVPMATPTTVPTVVPTSTPVVVPTATPDVEIKSEFDIWLKLLMDGTITWEDYKEVAIKNNWETKETYEEVSTTYYVYNPDGTIAYTTTVTTGSKNTNGTGNSTQTEKDSGSAKVEANVTGSATGTATTTITGKNSTSKKPSGVAHVKVSGSKITWITKTGKTKTVFFVKKNGKFKYRKIRGKNVVAGGFIEKNQLVVIRMKNGNWYTISIKNHKIQKRSGKCYGFYRDRNGFVKAAAIKKKSGGYKKVSVKNYKVTKGTYKKTITK